MYDQVTAAPCNFGLPLCYPTSIAEIDLGLVGMPRSLTTPLAARAAEIGRSDI